MPIDLSMISVTTGSSIRLMFPMIPMLRQGQGSIKRVIGRLGD